jgi:excinuclease UvrABC nuclease subunit
MEKSAIDFSTLPDSPGVYFFMKGTEVVYVGKATSLRSRVRSYFDPGLAEKRSELVAQVITEATTLRYEETDSVLEALILEANKIRELKPHGNTDAKDDKSFNYVVITKEEIPRVLTFRGRELATAIAPGLVTHLFGPFTQGGSLKEAMKIIRRIFPFFDTKYPINEQYSPAQRKTLRFNQSIGIYPSDTDREAYKRTIRHIVLLFEGKKKALIKSLETEMNRAAREERFEDAETAKRQVFALTHIQDIALIKEEYKAPPSTAFRIEAYDTAHLGGSAARGVMVAIVDGEPVKDDYRIFTIRHSKDADDYAALREILTRRMRHSEWPMPKLIVIDGGRAHLKVAREVMKKLGKDIEIVSVVKDAKHKPREILGKKATAVNHEASILLANAEAHRFSIGRHRWAMRKRVQ